ncbi:hypothetical protein BPC006_II1291 [Burkholderia pseudomallei BPC006]|nr:hypothetical protein BPC006_II1291 [Burkholderia pseudomallei BPC006]EEP87976.1 hypothetical protein BMAGB8_A1471 [Burkholderia mallei GB8 horse 4]
MASNGGRGGRRAGARFAASERRSVAAAGTRSRPRAWREGFRHVRRA